MSNQPGKMSFTEEQQQAIVSGNVPKAHRKVGNVLVSASAGSGKTRVLIERIIQKILTDDKENRISLDRLVVVTFTESAAKEMKERLEKALQEAISNETDYETRRFLQEQLGLLPIVNIQTIDAFCRQIVNQFYYLIGLDPNYRLLSDQTELVLLKQDVWEKLVSDALSREENDPLRVAYETVAKNFSDGRQHSSDRLYQMIISLFDKARSHANPKQWLEHLSDSYAYQPFVESTVVKNDIIGRFIEELEAVTKQYQNVALPDIFDTEARSKNEEILSMGDNQQLCRSYHEGKLDYAILHNHKPNKIRLNSFKGPADKEEYKEDFENFKEEIKRINKIYDNKIKKKYDKFFGFSPEILDEIIKQVGVIADRLILLVQTFLEKIDEAMAEKNVLDFAGIELKALEILNATNDDGNYEARDYYHERIDEVLIDEYQDVNDLQEQILKLIGEDDNHQYRFMVGDLKQSIYRFRYSNPDLFREKHHDYQSDENSSQLIELQKNFRSRPEVLNFVNMIFNRLMDDELGGIDYSKANLESGKTAEPLEPFLPEIHVVDQSEKEEDKSEKTDDQSEESKKKRKLSKVERQAHITAQRIQSLIGQIFPGQEKAVQYSDIAILTNTRGSYSEIENVFNQYGIPIHQDKREDYFTRTEIMTMVSILKLVDNPNQDIPLTAVLRSPIVGLKEPELARIRSFGDNYTPENEKDDFSSTKGQPFFSAVNLFNCKMNKKQDNLGTEDKEIADALKSFFKQLNSWRTYQRTASLSELLWRIYRDTEYLVTVSSQSHSEQRRSNLYGLIQLANDFEQQGQRGLFQFVRYIEEISRQKKDIETPQDLNPNSNSVELMTVHSSKGLEYPVVIYFDASHGFNKQDYQQSPYIVSEKYGLGFRWFDRKNIRVIDSLIFEMAKLDEKKQSYSEEMRKLYVALTRAEQKLIIVSSAKSMDMTPTDDTPILSQSERLAAGNNWGWIVAALKPYLSLKEEDAIYELKSDGTSFATLEVHREISKENVDSTVDNQQSSVSSTKQIIKYSPITFNYPYDSATTMDSNGSVSDLKRQSLRFDDPHMTKEQEWINSGKKDKTQEQTDSVTSGEYLSKDWSEPEFKKIEKERSAAEHGTAVHLLMQKIALEEGKAPNYADFYQLAQELVASNEVRENIYTKSDFEKLSRFFMENEMGRRISDNVSRLYREQPFTLSIAAEQYAKWTNQMGKKMAEDDRMIIHGIIDGFFIDQNDEVWLFDYKTDHMGGLDREKVRNQLLKRYKLQLSIYHQALESALQRKVTHNVLISLDTLEVFDYPTDRLDL